MKKATSAVSDTMQIVQSARRNSYLHDRGIDPSKDAQLRLNLIFDGLIHDNERFLPNDYARSALFTVRNKREPRRALQNEAIFHLHDSISILYTGIELRAYDDELVWLQILHYGAKLAPLGDSFTFSIGDLVRDLDWNRSSYYYDIARESISRLKASEILINNEKSYGNGLSQSLIKHYEFENDANGKPNRYTVWIDRNLIYLLAGKTFTNHNWERYRKLSPIARRMVDYIASNRHPHPLTLTNFALMCDTKLIEKLTATTPKYNKQKTPSKWKQMVQEAAQEVMGYEAKQILIEKQTIYITR